jgi:catechol 2,3-dioxygenase
MGIVGLIVADLERSLRYYQENIGLRLNRTDGAQAWLGAGGKDLLLLTEQEGAKPVQRGRTGLYHFALLVPSRPQLAQVLRHLIDTRTPMSGWSDHKVSEALYLSDPDGHGIEIYRDRPREEWPVMGGEVRMTVDPLDAEGLLAELPSDGVAWTGMADGTTMGHVHLHVRNLSEAHQFYCGVLGFDAMQIFPRQALFVSAGGYHHHLGLNVWAGEGAPPAPNDAARLDFYEIRIPSPEGFADCVARLSHAGLAVHTVNDEAHLVDPSGNRIHLVR